MGPRQPVSQTPNPVGARPVPTAAHQRLQALDVMRGVALLGIFIMNLPSMGRSFFEPDALAMQRIGNYGASDHAVFMLSLAMLEGKFNGLFTLLFGMGLGLQLERLGPSDRGVIARRMITLLVFGLLHLLLLWGGDVLHIYAFLGLLLWMVRHWSPGALARLAALFLLAQFALGAGVAWVWNDQTYQAGQALLQALQQSDNSVYAQGTWMAGIPQRLVETLLTYSSPHLLPLIGWFWLALASTAVLGLWVCRSGWLEADSAAQRWLCSGAGRAGLWLLFVVALGCWLASGALTADQDPALAPSAQTLLGLNLGDTHRVLMTLCYAGLILRWCLLGGAAALRRNLALVGRMPLTMYLMQSLMGTFIFHGWGLGLWEQLGPTACVALAVTLFALVQMPLARWWLARHPMGPAEALWRRVSYAQPRAKRLP